MNKRPIVLLADDDEDDREIFAEVLNDIDPLIKVITVEDGTHLLEKLTHQKVSPDYIFLDLNMPCISGHDCLIKIRKLPMLDHVPIIIYSTSTRAEDIEVAYRKGANLYVNKPNSFKKIEMMIRHLFSLDWSIYFPSPPKHLFYIG